MPSKVLYFNSTMFLANGKYKEHHEMQRAFVNLFKRLIFLKKLLHKHYNYVWTLQKSKITDYAKEDLLYNYSYWCFILYENILHKKKLVMLEISTILFKVFITY